MTETRNNLLHDIEEDSHDHMYVQTFVLPDLTKFPPAYRAFLEKDLIETSTLVSLEQAGESQIKILISECRDERLA